MKCVLLTALVFLSCFCPVFSQDLLQTIRGYVTDIETGLPLPGANIIITNSIPLVGTTADSAGKFSLDVSTGRISLKITFLGYEDFLLRDVLLTTGREVIINAGLREKVVRTEEIIIRSGAGKNVSISKMASVSTSTIRTEDALHYAGGFYDPSRIVNAFAGVSTANSDDSNDLIIRGNSPRGLLWRIEGIEIPNPNHFSSGMGGSGGAFSSITSNVIDNFDFFTGAFPAEFGNAFSGVMDLNLRRGNPEKYEHAFQTGMIGAEVAYEGPLPGSGEASYLINARYTNFNLLSSWELIDLGDINYAPRTKDIVFNIYIPLKKLGSFNFFGIGGESSLGKKAEKDISKWSTGSDRWQEMEKQGSFTAGIKHFYSVPGGKTYLKSVAAWSTFSDKYNEGYVDSSLVQTDSYLYDYKFSSLRVSVIANHKINARHSVRAGINYDFLAARMSNLRLISSGVYDTLVAPTDDVSLFQSHIQWKYRTGFGLEINSGFHFQRFSMNDEFCIEPRLGFRWELRPGVALIGGLGLHSRTESLAAYNSLIKDTDGIRRPLNHDLDMAKAFHAVAGTEITLFSEIRLRLEWYYQDLYDIPIVNKSTSRYSTLNTAERLPEEVLENAGKGRNTGIEITIEKAFTDNYYFLATGSLFDSWYSAGDDNNYNTLYNTRYVSNILAGKDFCFGKNKRNTIGINAKMLLRGGYRYTPVNITRSLKVKKIVYLTSLTNEEQLPGFLRIDGGLSFRRNFSNGSWIIMLDMQNVTGRKNVFKRRFSYENGKVVFYDVHSLGLVPVFNFRIEF